MSRRLPAYLVLDVSGSMEGAGIEAVRQGVQLLVSELKADPRAIETAYLSVITFASTAQQVVPLTEVLAFSPPPLQASGGTALGEALRCLCRCVDAEVRKGSKDQKGDWRPLVFLMTDGQPTDDWESALPEVHARKWGAFVACAAGPQALVDPLKKITDMVVKLHEVQQLASFFKWVSQSIQTASVSAQGPGPAGAGVPPPPPGVQIVP